MSLPPKVLQDIEAFNKKMRTATAVEKQEYHDLMRELDDLSEFESKKVTEEAIDGDTIKRHRDLGHKIITQTADGKLFHVCKNCKVEVV